MPNTKRTCERGLCAPWEGFGAPACEFRCALQRHRSSLRSAGRSLLLGSAERLRLAGRSLFPEETLRQDGGVEGTDGLGVVTQTP